MDYAVGDTVAYQLFGGGVRSGVRVVSKEADIKNGQPGFDGTCVGPDGEQMTVWGYDDQILSVQVMGEAVQWLR